MGIYCILAAVLSKLNSLGTHEHAKVSEIRLRVDAKVIFFFFGQSFALLESLLLMRPTVFKF